MKQVFNRQNVLVPGSSPSSVFSRVSISSCVFVFLPAFLLLLITGCQKNEVKDPAQKNDMSSTASRGKGKTNCVPFKASFITMDEMTQAATDANPIQKDHLTGTGEGTALGRASLEVFAEGDVTLPFPALITSSLTFIAANGDKLFETGEGYLQEPAPNADILHLTGTGTITGGTGRFAGATGNLSFDVTQNMMDPKGTVAFTGTICY